MAAAAETEFSLVSGGVDNTVRRFDTLPNTNQVWAADAKAAVLSLSWVGDKVAAGCRDGWIRIFNAANGELIKEFEAHTRPNGNQDVNSVAISPTGDMLVSVGVDCCVKLWRTTSYLLAANITDHAQAITGVAWINNGGKYSFVSCSIDRTARIWTPVLTPTKATAKLAVNLAKRIDLSKPGNSVAVSGDQTLLAVGETDGLVEIFRTVDGGPVKTMNNEVKGKDVVSISSSSHVTAAPKKFVLGITDERRARFWDMGTGKAAQALDLPPLANGDASSAISVVTYSKLGQYVAAGDFGNRLRVWRTTDRQVVSNVALPNPITSALATKLDKVVVPA